MNILAALVDAYRAALAALEERSPAENRDRGDTFILRGTSSLEELGATGAEILTVLEAAGIALVVEGPEKTTLIR